MIGRSEMGRYSDGDVEGGEVVGINGDNFRVFH